MIIDYACPKCKDEMIIHGDEGFFNEQELHEIEQHGTLNSLCNSCQEHYVRDM
jgi:primosomal protein N'